MVQKSAAGSAKRGRPRAYDPGAALEKATLTFWDAGFAATSLDDLAAATAMNRPSLYAAFGDKEALYRTVLEGYRAGARAAMKEALDAALPLREGLRRVYASALAMYLPAGRPPRGCFMIGTAVTEAVQDDAVRDSLNEGLREIDRAFEARFRQARDRGELPADADPAALARLASGVLYFLAVRSRAGEPRAVLEATAEAGVALLTGAASRAGGKAASRRARNRSGSTR
ncbi:MAG TPA: TetR/AcrR family transcriptional regulator [Alphaproteobacteria bacterium]|nr:TetR/AcrR family transcriptional regulator [Alphaproteobacteria bacterium]